MSRRALRYTALLLMPFTMSCIEDPPLEITHVTEHLEIGTDFNKPVCAGNLSLMDAQVDFVAQALGFTFDETISVYWYESSSDIDLCSERVVACTTGDGDVYTNWRSMSHELVHAVAHEFNRDAAPVFTEGLAVMLEGTALRHPDFDLSDVIAHQHLSSIEYEGVGHFTRWLVDTYGIDTYLIAYEVADWSDDVAESQEEAFELAYNKSWSELLDEYSRDAPDYYRGLGPFETCATDALPWDGEVWEHTVTVDCASDSTIARVGNLDGPEKWRRVVVEIPETGPYQLSYSGGSDAVALAITACMPNDTAMKSELPPVNPWLLHSVWGDHRVRSLFHWFGWPANFRPDQPLTFSLKAGRYAVWLGTQELDAVDISVSLRPDPSP